MIETLLLTIWNIAQFITVFFVIAFLITSISEEIADSLKLKRKAKLALLEQQELVALLEQQPEPEPVERPEYFEYRRYVAPTVRLDMPYEPVDTQEGKLRVLNAVKQHIAENMTVNCGDSVYFDVYFCDVDFGTRIEFSSKELGAKWTLFNNVLL